MPHGTHNFSLSTQVRFGYFAVVFSSQLHAQYENGSLLGTVRDSSGAPIANAALTITNTATAITTQAKTNDVGDYNVRSLRVGVYTITASSPGFSDAVAQKLLFGG